MESKDSKSGSQHKKDAENKNQGSAQVINGYLKQSHFAAAVHLSILRLHETRDMEGKIMLQPG